MQKECFFSFQLFLFSEDFFWCVPTAVGCALFFTFLLLMLLIPPNRLLGCRSSFNPNSSYKQLFCGQTFFY